MQVRDRHANEHTALTRLGGDFYQSKKGVALFTGPYLKSLSLSTSENQTYNKISSIGDSCHQNIKKYVAWGLKSQKFYVFSPCNLMEPFIVVCALLTHTKVAIVIV